MKPKFFPPFKDEGELVASWGEARLIKYLDGKTELRGGSDQDRAEAREWMSMFLNDGVVVKENKSGYKTTELTLQDDLFDVGLIFGQRFTTLLLTQRLF